jgi:hypothetical protein
MARSFWDFVIAWPLLCSTGGTKRFNAWIAGTLDYLSNYIARTASLAALLLGFTV